MKKKWPNIIGCSLLVMVLGCCAGTFHPPYKNEIARSELMKMGSGVVHFEQRELTLTQDDKVKLQALLGHPPKYYPKSLTYYREIRHHYGEIGDIVPLYQETPYGRLVILVRIWWHAIDKIVVVENVTKEGKPIVNDTFLSQFVGRTATSSYKTIKDPQDLLGARTNIKPIAGEPEISREIADRLQEIIAIHAVDNF